MRIYYSSISHVQILYDITLDSPKVLPELVDLRIDLGLVRLNINDEPPLMTES
jgi:hypothetical protein